MPITKQSLEAAVDAAVAAQVAALTGAPSVPYDARVYANKLNTAAAAMLEALIAETVFARVAATGQERSVKERAAEYALNCSIDANVLAVEAKNIAASK